MTPGAGLAKSQKKSPTRRGEILSCRAFSIVEKGLTSDWSPKDNHIRQLFSPHYVHAQSLSLSDLIKTSQ